MSIGTSYMKQKEYQLASEFLTKGLLRSQEIGSLEVMKQCYEALSNMYNQQGNYQKALANYKLYVVVRDSMYDVESTTKITALQLQYDTEKKEKEIALLTKDSKLQQAELQKQNTTRNSFIGGLILVSLLALISFNRYSVKRKANNKIEKTLAHLKSTQEQLIEREKLASLGKLTLEVAKQMEVPVTQINQLNIKNRNIINYLKDNVATLSNSNLEELKNNLKQIYYYGKDADGIVKKVLTETRKTQG